jgi:hypothetical protein
MLLGHAEVISTNIGSAVALGASIALIVVKDGSRSRKGTLLPPTTSQKLSEPTDNTVNVCANGIEFLLGKMDGKLDNHSKSMAEMK